MSRTQPLVAPILAATLIASSSGLADAQIAQGWSQREAGGFHLASYKLPLAQLTVRCKGAAVEVIYEIAPDEFEIGVRGRPEAVMGVVIDGSSDLLWTTGNIGLDRTVASLTVGGQAAGELAHKLADAAREVVVSILIAPPDNNSVDYNRLEFPVDGAADAIKAAYAGCGIKF